MASQLRQMIRLSGKEWRLLFRNPHGLAVLFFMPAVFVLIMAFSLKDSLVGQVNLPVTGWLVEDPSSVADLWAIQWQDQHGAQVFSSRSDLRAALKRREVQAGVIVLDGWLDSEGFPDAGRVEVWIDGRVHPAAASRLRTDLAFAVLALRARIFAAKAGIFASMFSNSEMGPNAQPKLNAPALVYLDEIDSGQKMTAVQRSVPAWLVFGMFFVVIPIAGVLIQERDNGTFARLVTFNVTPGTMLGGKAITFMLLNWVQLALMLAVGRWLVPWLGGDALHLDVAPGWFLLMVSSTSAGAVGFAMMIAAFSNSFDHAAALGSGLNVVLGAIAGVMVPRALMPPSLQAFSEWSPMGWALDGMQTVFLGVPDAQLILIRAGLLFLFAMSCYSLALWRSTKTVAS